MSELLKPPLRYFSLYLAVIAGLTVWRLTVWALPFSAMLGVMAWLAWRHGRRQTWGSLAALCAFLAVAMNVSYQTMAFAVPAVRTVRFDAELLALDRLVLGETPAVLLQDWNGYWQTELMSVCYIFFMPLLFFNLLRYFLWRRELLGEFYSGLFTVYGFGFLGYVLVPAAGPWLAYPELFCIKLDGGVVTRLNRLMVEQGSIRVDVWPSLHCAVSLFILGFAWRHHRLWFWLLLMPVTGLWLSTFYLHYHYLIDMLCGFALAAYALRAARRHAWRFSHFSTKAINHDPAT